jgi:hypothetical protein
MTALYVRRRGYVENLTILPQTFGDGPLEAFDCRSCTSATDYPG